MYRGFAEDVLRSALAKSFTKRYEVWLATHSLLYYRDQQEAAAQHQAGKIGEDDVAEDRERKERCCMATADSDVGRCLAIDCRGLAVVAAKLDIVN